jgi:hypothetical protein
MAKIKKRKKGTKNRKLMRKQGVAEWEEANGCEVGCGKVYSFLALLVGC